MPSGSRGVAISAHAGGTAAATPARDTAPPPPVRATADFGPIRVLPQASTSGGGAAPSLLAQLPIRWYVLLGALNLLLAAALFVRRHRLYSGQRELR